MRVVRLILPVLAALALTTVGLAATPTPVANVPPPPDGLHGFLLSPNEVDTHSFIRTPSFAWDPVRGAVRYQFELSTSSSFVSNAILWLVSDEARYPVVDCEDSQGQVVGAGVRAGEEDHGPEGGLALFIEDVMASLDRQ